MKRSATVPPPAAVLAFVCVVAASGWFASCGGGKQEDKPMIPAFSPPSVLPSFDGARAFDLLTRQVAFGPRVPNTPAHSDCLDFYLRFFDSLGVKTETQRFDIPGYDGVPLRLTNVIARLRPDVPERILLCAHWDSRPFADRETDPLRAARPIPGANDGASGVAVLLRIAEILAQHPASVGVDLVLFDGEDYGRDGDESMFLLGSKYFAASLDATPRYRFGVLLDLVGDRDAEFPIEEFSRQYAGDIQRMLWAEARRLGLGQFSDRRHGAILDDHVPLNTVAGIKTVNIIDAALVGGDPSSPRRKYWHTLDDTPAQCAPETLEAVGRLLLSIILGSHAS